MSLGGGPGHSADTDNLTDAIDTIYGTFLWLSCRFYLQKSNASFLFSFRTEEEEVKQHNTPATVWVKEGLVNTVLPCSVEYCTQHHLIVFFFQQLCPLHPHRLLPHSHEHTRFIINCAFGAPIFPFPPALSVVRSVLAKAPLQKASHCFSLLCSVG